MNEEKEMFFAVLNTKDPMIKMVAADPENHIYFKETIEEIHACAQSTLLGEVYGYEIYSTMSVVD